MSSRLTSTEWRKREYRQKGYWGDATLADYWKMAVLSSPEKIAVVDLERTCYTYAELDDASDRVAAFLKDAGVIPGDFVSVQLPNWAEFTVIYVACLKVGAVINPILPCYRAEELLHILTTCESKVFFYAAEFRQFNYLKMVDLLVQTIPSLRETVMVEKEKTVNEGHTFTKVIQEYRPLASDTICKADDLAAVLFTSGTSGSPKGVMFTHNNIIASEKAFAAAFHFSNLDVMLMPAPVAHATGFHHGVTATFMFAAKSVLQDIFKPDTCLALIEREKCTCSMGAIPFVHDILCSLNKQRYDISSLRFFLCGGAPIPRHIVKEALDVGLKVLSVYGSTESVPHTAVGLHDPVEKVFNTDGVPVPGVEIRVVDKARHPLPAGIEGEQASRGPNVFIGYLKEPELTAQVLDDEGWYYSGDLCIMDDDGYIRITGRIKDVIIRGGENISSVEIENILLQFPNIREAGVVAMPDQRLGERICAYVVLNDADLGLTLEEVKSFFALKNVAKCKYPERIEIVEFLPQTPSGKIQKFVLRQDIIKKINLERLNRASI
ncbi:medium-chain fatty-acid--CoA ligase [Pelosinus propionicus]|uniref:Acyl-CoA synthetase n=1 Tax=Pelosinus propionicus DSM 13327 TaxID=1123291 RepID=A0A1I4I0P4_9FIRM|nr:medium-chain fatty-acid--CoA ligase [Pelosinus propionicus]SFL48008.1 acyl-CoA synthetase [Pelosinus propionicus DSM 13327]